jgi:hypothetical protein
MFFSMGSRSKRLACSIGLVPGKRRVPRGRTAEQITNTL